MRRFCWSACVLTVGWAVAAEAQPSPRPPDAPAPQKVEAQLRFNGSYFDNFFQASEGLPEENVLSGGVEAHLAARLRPAGPLQAYGHASYEGYRGFGPSTGLALGLRSDDRPGSFDLAMQYHHGRPSRDVGDVLDRADDAGVVAEYSYRVVDDLQLTALADARREWYDLAPQKRNDLFNLGAAARYRGWRELSPEIGFRWGRRGVQDDNEDLKQREVFVRLRWTPTSAVYLSLRYRRRHRDYVVDDPGRSNFGREDHREQWTLSADIRLSRHWSWGAYLAREESDSTRDTGVFTTQLATVSLALRN
jgi:hypothetical protein